MKILYLSNNLKFSLFEKLKKCHHQVTYYDKKIDEDYILKENIGFIISYNYKYIIPSGIVSKLKNRIVNLHISYLPFNRGAHPNVWSFLDNTPKGITIHYIDEGIDTGDVILQKEMFFDETNETFETTYEKLNYAIQNLFLDNFDKILNGETKPKKQEISSGTFHKRADLEPILKYFGDRFWKLPISTIKRMIKELGLYATE